MWQLEHGRAHIDRNAAVGVEAQLDHAAVDLDAHDSLVSQALLVHIAHKAARAVAAVLDLAAIGVVDQVLEVDLGGRRRAHGQDLVGSDTEMAVGQETVLGGAQAEAGGGRAIDWSLP